MENQLVTTTDIFSDVQKFELAQRAATALSKSTMVPDHFRGNLGNCMIALNFSARTGLDVFMVMQKMYIIKGRPGIEAQLAIALVNKSGRFADLDYEFKEDQSGCRAYAKNQNDKICYGPWVTMDMAKKEGWSEKSGSKWKTMPEVMLGYRAAMFFARKYCPEALMGMYSDDELKAFDRQPIDVAPSFIQIDEQSDNDPGLKELSIMELQEIVADADQESVDRVWKKLGMTKYPDDDDSIGWNKLVRAIKEDG